MIIGPTFIWILECDSVLNVVNLKNNMEKFLLTAYYVCQAGMVIVPLIGAVSLFLNRNKKEHTESSYLITTKEE